LRHMLKTLNKDLKSTTRKVYSLKIQKTKTFPSTVSQFLWSKVGLQLKIKSNSTCLVQDNSSQIIDAMSLKMKH
jgi:hypothetical protein